jgi:hypothetical protein
VYGTTREEGKAEESEGGRKKEGRDGGRKEGRGIVQLHGEKHVTSSTYILTHASCLTNT